MRAELDGELAPTLALERMQLKLDTSEYGMYFADEVYEHGTYSVSCDGDGAQLIFTATDGEHRGRRVPALFQISVNGHLLRVCYGLDGTLPVGFSTAPGSQRYLVTYRRARL
jgi:hypothetical protein